MFSGLLIILVGLFWTLSNQFYPSWTMVPKIGEKREQQKNHIPCHADSTPVYISQYGVCFSCGNLNSSDFSSACNSQLPQILLCWLFHIPYLYIWLLLPKYRTVVSCFRLYWISSFLTPPDYSYIIFDNSEVQDCVLLCFQLFTNWCHLITELKHSPFIPSRWLIKILNSNSFR